MIKENAYYVAEDTRMSFLEALLTDDLKKHVQLNRARLTSYGVLGEEIKTYCECRGHANARNVRQEGPSHPGGDDPMDIGAFGKGKGTQSKGKHGKGKGKGQQGQQGQHGQDRDKSKDKSKDSVECWNCGRRGHCSKDCWLFERKQNPRMQMLTILTRNCQLPKLLVQEEHQRLFERKQKPKSADAHNLDSKPSLAEPEVEIDEFSMTYFIIDTSQEFKKVQESEWIKIGVGTGAGKTAWLQSIMYGTTIPGDSDLTFRTAIGELVKGGKRMQIARL